MRTAGQMAGMTAIVLYGLGSRRESRAWFATAESGNSQLHAWVLAREAMVPLNYGAPRAGAGLADQARQAAGHQQTEQAHAALAGALMERLPEGERSDTWLTYGEQKHHVRLSHAFTTLADTRRPNESQHRALELSAPSRTMTRSLLHIDAAACSHRGRPGGR
ncbi:hypothetical protein ACF1HJ_42970 [Streptomyces sp. NPDC013978]|uniref:hypothetical protein n=1 Tax=Streptomyces sp. NPDC013978 TaxID=3364869 RepID=UPI0036FA5D27